MYRARLSSAVLATLLTMTNVSTRSALAAGAAAQSAGTSDTLAEVVVTGSLIQRKNNTSVSPITTVSAASVKQTGQTNIEDALNQVPGFTVGGNAATGGQGTGGRATIDLHGLGSNRNLVLLDGRRLPLSDISGDVDLNILPEAFVSGVDVITGGASAVYGSDAMSGVVNFKSAQYFDGVQADVQDGVSEKGDANRFDASLSMGTKFADDRGHLDLILSDTKEDPLPFASRGFFFKQVPSSFLGTGEFVPSATNAPSAAVLTSLFNSYGVSGAINPLGSNLGFNNNGTLYTVTGAKNYLGPNGTNGYLVLGNNVRMPVGQQGNILNGLTRKAGFAKADYDLTPTLDLYTQFMIVDLVVNSNSGGSLTQFPTLTTIPVTNPFIPADLHAVLASRPNPNAPFSWIGRYVGIPWKNWDERYNVERYLTGLRGDLAGGWHFDVFGSYDQTVHDSAMNNAVLKSNVQTLLNAPDGGASICAGGFNPFGDANARALSPACVAYMSTTAVSVEKLSQTQFQGQINRTLFRLPAGRAQLALVADWRQNTYSYSPDVNLTANSGWAPGGNVEAFTATLPVPEKSIDLKEFAGQIDIPLLADRPWVREFAVGAAGRVSDYSTSGSVPSYEFDVRWRPIDPVLVRGSYQRAVRAPNIGELFQPASGTQLVIGTPPASLGDPCDVRSTARTGANGAQVANLCIAQGVPSALAGTYQFPTTATGQTVAGNSTLSPEKADTFNLGIVFTPSMHGGLFSEVTTSLDYYNIAIKNVISAVPGLTVLSKCYNLDGSNPGYSPANSWCKLLQRDQGTGQLLQVNTPYLNLAALKTDGFEAQVNLGIASPWAAMPGTFYLDTNLNFINRYLVQLLPGTPYLDYTGVSVGGANPGAVPSRAEPRLAGLTTIGYRARSFDVGARWRYQSSMADVSSILTPKNAAAGVASYQLWDLFATVNVTAKLQLRAGVNNLFSAAIPYVASSQNGSDPALYDVIGRNFYVGAKASF